MIKAVVFDLDDTLYPEHSYVDSGFKAVDCYLAHKYKIHNFYNIANRLFIAGHRGKIFNEVLALLGFSNQDELIKELIDVYRNHKPSIKLDIETIKVLEFFSQNYKTALITDGYKSVQRNKIEALNLAQHFDFICITDEFGKDYWKPHEKPYIATENALNVRATECVYIGDNPAKDFITPNRRNWRTVRVMSDDGEYSSLISMNEFEAQIQTNSLSNLPNLLSI